MQICRVICQKAIRPFLISLFLSLMAGHLNAQDKNCSSVLFQDVVMPLYAPIARAAHVEGIVTLEISLSSDLVPSVKLLSGPKMLEGPATDYIQARRYSRSYTTKTPPCTYIAQIEYRILKSESDEPNNFYRVTVMGMMHTLVEVQPIKPTCSDCVDERCPVGNISVHGKPAYPPAARAARISGDVSLQVRFDSKGDVAGIEQWDGPPMLEQATKEWLNTWKRDTLPDYMRSCLMSVMLEYRLTEATEQVESEVHVVYADPTHLLIEDHPALLVDPASPKTKRKRFLIF